VRQREVLTLVHHHPGRLRVRAGCFREGDAVDVVRAALDVEPGISAFSHNARTGSLLVEYEPGLADAEAILSTIAQAAGLEMPADIGTEVAKKPALIAIDAAREANELVAELTGHQTDLRTLVPMGLAALAVYSAGASKHELLPRWDNLLYWSYNIFCHLHGREIQESGRARQAAAAGAAYEPFARGEPPEPEPGGSF
jgi:Heavy metal associated domain 2